MLAQPFCDQLAPNARLESRLLIKRMLCVPVKLLPVSAAHRSVIPCSSRSCFSGQALSSHGSVRRLQAPHGTLVLAASQRQDSFTTLPKIDWTRYHLQVLFVDRSDSHVHSRCILGVHAQASSTPVCSALCPSVCSVQFLLK